MHIGVLVRTFHINNAIMSHQSVFPTICEMGCEFFFRVSTNQLRPRTEAKSNTTLPLSKTYARDEQNTT